MVMKFTDDYTKTHFLKGESTLDEIPDVWLIQYTNAHATKNSDQMGIIKQLTGLSHSELLDLADSRKNP